MLSDPNADVTAPARPWWERTLDTAIDVVEDRILDPVDEVVTPKIERYQSETAHRRVSEARRTLERRAISCWNGQHQQRARLLHTWSELESAASNTRAGLHAHHIGPTVLEHSDSCCAGLIRLYTDRAEVIRGLAVVEDQIARRLPGRSPNFGAMPARLRRQAETQFAEMVTAPYRPQCAEAASALAALLERDFGAAVDPIRRIYVG